MQCMYKKKSKQNHNKMVTVLIYLFKILNKEKQFTCKTVTYMVTTF